jgi:hypothetical protein
MLPRARQHIQPNISCWLKLQAVSAKCSEPPKVGKPISRWALTTQPRLFTANGRAGVCVRRRQEAHQDHRGCSELLAGSR